MRFVAMKLHTKDQAPKEGGKEAAPQPFQKVSIACLHSDLASKGYTKIVMQHSVTELVYTAHTLPTALFKCCSGSHLGRAT